MKQSRECQMMAQMHAADMAQNEFFSHTSPTSGSFSHRAQSFEIGGYRAENIAMGRAPLEAVRGWMNSRGHFKNIMN
ncbi:MAG: CAP domain-containing protein, partial [Bdellovibrionota bacterium]